MFIACNMMNRFIITQPQQIHPRIRIPYISKYIKPTQEFNRVFTYIPPRLRVIIPKSVVTEFNLTIIVLPLVFKRTPKILFWCEPHGQGGLEVLFAFPYQFAFLVVGSSLVHSDNGVMFAIYISSLKKKVQQTTHTAKLFLKYFVGCFVNN